MKHPPYQAWQLMDNYLTHFLFEHPDIDRRVASRIKHFQYQYLTKVSNICPLEAAIFEQNISPWSPAGKGDYHRLYHMNTLLNEIEAALSPSNDFHTFLIGNRKSFEAYPSIHRHGGIFDSVEGQDILVVPKSEQIVDFMRQFIGESGFTPTLQQAAGIAAHLSLYQPNLTYEFPKQNVSEFPLFSHPILSKFREISFSASALVDLLEGFAPIDLDAIFQKKGISTLLQNSYGRVLHYLEESRLIDLSQYMNWPKFEALLDLAHEEMLLWLIIGEPHPDGALENSIGKIIAPPSLLKITSTGMAAFSEILKVVLKPDLRILLYDGCYFENRASLLKAHPSENIHLVSFPDYRASLITTLKQLKEQNKTIDLLFVNFHENLLKGRFKCHENEVIEIVSQILRSGCASFSLTVVIDHTIGYLDSEEIKALLNHFASEIGSKSLHIVVLRSHQKFDLFGFDKISAGSYSVYSDDEPLLNRFEVLSSDKIDFVSRQALSHYFASAPERLEERKRRIFSNALYVNEKIGKDLKFNPEIREQPILVVVKEDSQNFSIDVQATTDLESTLCDSFRERGVPLMIRSGFGFNLTTVAFTRFNMVRFSIGIEDRIFLDQFVDAFNHIFAKNIS